MIFFFVCLFVKNIMYMVFLYFSFVVGSTTVFRICDCFKNMFFCVVWNKICLNEIILFVRIILVMNLSCIVDVFVVLLDDADASSSFRSFEFAAFNFVIFKYDFDFDFILLCCFVVVFMLIFVIGSKFLFFFLMLLYDRVSRKFTSSSSRFFSFVRFFLNIFFVFFSINCSFINLLCVFISFL